MEQALSGQNVLAGEQFSVADAYLFVILGWCQHMQIDLAPYPALVAFQQRIATRPAVQRALKEEGLA
ncbi:Glutathione S-transferase GstA [compost metagenome]